VNCFIATGNLGKDIDISKTKKGTSIGAFPLPVKQGWGDIQTTSWVYCKMYGDRVEKLAPHLVKGKEVTVQGKFVYEQWEKDGVKQGRPVIIVDDLKMHSSNASPQKPAPKKPSETTFFDDEIPF